jgi:hypothetical protein
MKACLRHRSWIAALCLGLLQIVRAGAQDADGSPFLPSPAAGASAAAENQSLELHGIMPTSDGVRFCIYDSVKKTSKWVGLNDAGAGDAFVVKSADPNADTVSVLSGGRLMTLVMRKPKVDSSFVANFGAGLPPGVSVVLNPTAADEQRRLQAIAQEVRRRRLLREQADR